MIEIILDTETTGLSAKDGHKIVEIGCVELEDQVPTGNTFHSYVNPQRNVPEEALKIHGYTNEFLSKQKSFSEIVDSFILFIKNKKLVIHNAAFDLSFLNNELKAIKKELIDPNNVIDTLLLAREKFPGAQASLDALCKKFKIDNSRRKKHSALVDCQLLKEVYINLVDQKEPKLNLENDKILDSKFENQINKKKNNSKIIVKLNNDELKLHRNYLKSSLQKNYFD